MLPIVFLVLKVIFILNIFLILQNFSDRPICMEWLPHRLVHFITISLFLPMLKAKVKVFCYKPDVALGGFQEVKAPGSS